MPPAPTTPIVVLDLESTGLNRFTDEPWELAAVRIDPDGTRTSWEVFVQHDPAKAARLPDRFRADRDTRYRPGQALTVPELLGTLRAVFAVPEGTPYIHRPHVYGAVPEFDLAILGRLFHEHGTDLAASPLWHHHTTDVETFALGWLRGRRETLVSHGTIPADSPMFPGPPWDSDGLSRAVGVDPTQFARHTAMGDVAWAIAIAEQTGAIPAVTRVSTYIYEVTASNEPCAPVGTLLVDTAEMSARGEPRTWTLYRPGTGFTHGWSGTCLHRVCTDCRGAGVLRAHRHPGPCGSEGSAPILTPVRIATTAPDPTEAAR